MKIQYPDLIPPRRTTGNLSEAEYLERYNWLVKFARLNGGLRPTYEDIATRGWAVSKTAVANGLETLEKMGWVAYPEGATKQYGMIFCKDVESKPDFVDLSDKQLPRVSIVITTYERPHSLQRLLDCISNQKHTDFDDIEVIILDDGSSQSYDDLNMSSYVQYVKFERRLDGLPNLYALKNRGVELARYEVIWLLDDDLVIDDHTLFIHRSYHFALEEARPVLAPHTANVVEPQYFQMPFQIDAQPADWDKLRVWLSFAGASCRKREWQAVGGIDLRYQDAMGFADLDLGMRLWQNGCQVMMIDGICVYVDDRETGSHRDRFIHTKREHHNGHLFMEKWGLEEAAKYGVTP